MDNNSLKVLEIDKILKLLSGYTKTKKGADICLSLKPLYNFEEVRVNLKEVSEAKKFITSQEYLPISETENAKKAIERSAIGGLLSEAELLSILSKIKNLTLIKDSFKDLKDKFPLLNKYIDQIKLQKEIEYEIETKISEDGEVQSNATSDLSKIRRNIKETRNLIYNKINELFNSQAYSKMFQENIITVRNNRYVIPLKSEYKTHFPCIVYDQSTSGETLFVEPLLITPLNNDYNILISQEKREIDKILATLSNMVKEKSKDLLLSIEIEEKLDIIFAKANLSIELDCSEPELIESPTFNIINAKHPLIPASEVVPIDINLGENFRTLIITGPNTGGKTVTLKTCGLLIIMTYCGLHIPASNATKIGFFRDIFADIGEEQDIVQSLSSFSSHLSNIIKILKLAKKDTLVLLDELGAGTDPDEGAALGMSIISYLHREEVPQIITTHLSQIKSFAYNHEMAENACVGFDLESLRPTYKVLIGVPGQSHAFQIAKRLGLSQDLIETAEKFLSKKDLEVKSLIDGLIRKTEKIEVDRITTESAKIEAEELRNKYEKEVKNFESSVKDKKRNLYLSASSEIKEISERAKNLLKELSNKKEASSEAHKIYEEIKAIEEETEDKIRELEEAEKNFIPLQDSSEISVGDSVWVKKYKLEGIVISKDDEKNDVEVLMGSFRTYLPISEISKSEPFKIEEEVIDTSGVKKRQYVPQKIDLHGLTVNEAVITLDKYLDDAYLSKLPIVYVMHGEGKGILRENIRKFLLTHPHVRDIEAKETFAIVYLK